MKLKLLFAALLCCGYSQASHLAAGQIFYDALGNNQYRITLWLYRDCNCVGCAPVADAEFVTVFNDSGNLFTQIFLPFVDSLPLSNNIPDTCLSAKYLCLQKVTYSATVTLPAAHFKAVYQRCCWALAENLAIDQGMTIWTDIYPGNTPPAFVSETPVYLEVNHTYDIDMHATDAQGDSLVYYMCGIYSGASINCPDPSPVSAGVNGCDTVPSAPPYTQVTYAMGLGPSNYINFPADTGALTINPATGIAHVTPNLVGTFIAAVCVADYRNDTLLNETHRYVIINVVNCPDLTGITALTGSDVKIYPNPTKDILHIQTPVAVQQITLTDLQGRVLQMYYPNSTTTSIDVSALSKGNYLLTIKGNDGLVVKKISVE